ncbi:MAG: hypothetical protein ACOYMN_00780 [Roseimicrobium sp.]
MHIRFVFPALLLFLGLSVGYWAGGRQRPVAPGLAPGAVVRPATPPATGGRALDAGSTKDNALAVKSPGINWEELSEDLPGRLRRLTSGLTLDQIQAGLRYLEAKPGGEANRALLTELMRGWARLDVNAAWQHALGSAPGLQRNSMLAAVAGELARTQPEQAVKLALSVPQPAARTNTLRGVLQDWAKVNPDAAVAYWNSHAELPSDVSLGFTMFSSSTMPDPAKAAALALGFRSASSMDNSNPELTAALQHWVQKDAAAAKAWAISLPSGAQRDRALRALANALVETQPQAALDALAQMTATGSRKGALTGLLTTWMRADPQAAIAHVSRMPEAEAKDVAGSLGYSMNALTIEEQGRLLGQLPDGAMKTDMMGTLVRNQTRAGRYGDAATMLNAMPDSSERDRALHELGIEWAGKDPAAVQAWLKQQADSSDRDLLVAGYAAALASTDPQGALTTVSGIPDTKVQRTALKNVYVKWRLTDLQAADAWLQSTPLVNDRERDSMKRMAELSMRFPMMLTPSIGTKR